VKPIILIFSFYYHFTAYNLRFGYISCSFDLQEFSTRYSQSYKAGHSTWKTRLTSIEVEPTISPRLNIYDLTTQVLFHLCPGVFSCPSSSIPTLVIHSVSHSLCSIHTNLSRLCFARHNAAHHDECTMPHTMFRHHDLNKISQFDRILQF
jgi:hypothetical protein